MWWEPLSPGAKSADIGRIASKHVKVTVSHKNSSTLNRERPVPARSPHKTSSVNTMMQNHVDEKEPQLQRKVEEMDTREGNYYFIHALT